METHYKHTQTGTTLMAIYGVVVLFMLYMLVKTGLVPAAVITLLVIVLIGAIFTSLTVEITSTELIFYFTGGAFRKIIKLSGIQTCKQVRNPWYYGLGIHLIPNGWVYNVSGLDAVEIVLKNGHCIRIGTDEPAILLAAFNQLIVSL